MDDLQLAGTIFGFVLLVLVLYRLLVQQKDANIQVLRDQLAARDKTIQELETRSPDVLMNTLTKRIEVSIAEIARLNADKEKHALEINEKHAELSGVQDRLKTLTALISESDLVCPTCGAPLVNRLTRTVYGHSGDREVEADLQYVEYECGYSEDEEKGTIQPCPHDRSPLDLLRP
jgi:DNA repair exonuclease SbcCD ATPase subunit